MEQAEALAKWAKEQTLLIVALGDYSFDYEIARQKHNPGFDAMVTNGPFMWIRPKKLIRTNCDMCYPAAVLDFIFLASPAKEWKATSKMLAPRPTITERKIVQDLSLSCNCCDRPGRLTVLGLPRRYFSLNLKDCGDAI